MTSPPYKTAGNANYYLAPNSPCRNAGTTTIDPDLLAELQTMTTYAPQDGSHPDNDGLPDLGYHYPVNEDSDHDGLPDWWEYYWFGNYTHTGSEVDAASNTLLAEYQSYANDGITNDPNIINFSIEATNDYINHINASVQLNVTMGDPAYYAVFVDSSTPTNWFPFTGTNLTVPLGPLGITDGKYNVIVGLKGPAPIATETWHDYGFTLDRVPPAVTITNPILATAVGVVTKPYLQLQGFADEQLASIS
ncbi:MAG: hypothetical protein P4N59_17455 [Negativicutes bacterium]|nr:hypothetical protein [Negativicutes bacterium]